MTLSETLKDIRNQLGYASARKFYGFLEAKRDLSFNYSYYTRVETGKTLPSKQIINEIATTLPSPNAEELVKAWCRDGFPNFNYLFKQGEPAKVATSETLDRKQKYLNHSQIAVITKSPRHYHFFTLLTLARIELNHQDIQVFLGGDTTEVIKEFIDVGLVAEHNNKILPRSHDLRFPKPDTKELQVLFKEVKGWNDEMREELEFNDLKKKFFIRRTSGRYLNMIIGFLDQIDELLRVADEIDTNLNNEVIIFDYKISSGKMPG